MAENGGFEIPTDDARPNSLPALAEAGRLAAFPDLAGAIRDFLKASRSEATVRAYTSDWRAFSAWCERRQVAALPAAPETLMAYASDLAGRPRPGRDKPVRPASIDRAMAAITVIHRHLGYDPPTAAAGVRATLSGIRRRLGTKPKAKKPVLVEDLKAMLRAVARRDTAIRDQALLLVGFAGAFRRSELAALNWEDVAFTREGLEITIRRSKTDQEGQGHKIGIPYGRAAAQCPVRALEAWRAAQGGPPRGRIFGITGAPSPTWCSAPLRPPGAIQPNTAATACAPAWLRPQPRAAPASAASWTTPGTARSASCAATSGRQRCSTTTLWPKRAFEPWTAHTPRGCFCDVLDPP